jgi:hypothetical protein
MLSCAAALSLPRPAAATCAGDDEPTRLVAPTALAAVQAVFVPTPGEGAFRLRAGDLVEGSGFQVRTLRVGLCGRVMTRLGRLDFAAVYEPWGVLERAQPDAQPWGRFTTLEVGLRLWKLVVVAVGIRKVPFDYGREAPEGALPLPLRPHITEQLSPDRRLGLTLDAEMGAARIAAGLYESARQLADLPLHGLLLAARASVRPFGPVGTTPSTVADDPYWRRRPRGALEAGFVYDWTPQTFGWAVTADVPFKYGPLGLVGSFTYALNMPVEGPTTLPRARFDRMGFVLDLAVMLWRPYLEVAARYEWLETPRDPWNRFHALTVGLTAYGWGARLRVQPVYMHKFRSLSSAAVPRDEDLLVLVLTLAI